VCVACISCGLGQAHGCLRELHVEPRHLPGGVQLARVSDRLFDITPQVAGLGAHLGFCRRELVGREREVGWSLCSENRDQVQEVGSQRALTRAG